jgi:hypothetical protein
MVKFGIYSFIATIMLGTLIGCTNQPPKIVYKTVDVPVQYTPAPPAVTRPVLDITTLTPAQKADIGELGKAYVITAKQLMQYSCLLEKVYDQYQVLSSKNPTLTPASSSSVAAPASTTALSESDAVTQANAKISSIVTQITLSPQDYNDCNKVAQ